MRLVKDYGRTAYLHLGSAPDSLAVFVFRHVMSSLYLPFSDARYQSSRYIRHAVPLNKASFSSADAPAAIRVNRTSIPTKVSPPTALWCGRPEHHLPRPRRPCTALAPESQGQK